MASLETSPYSTPRQELTAWYSAFPFLFPYVPQVAGAPWGRGLEVQTSPFLGHWEKAAGECRV